MEIAASATTYEGNLVLLGLGVIRLVSELHFTTQHIYYCTLIMQTACPTRLSMALSYLNPNRVFVNIVIFGE